MSNGLKCSSVFDDVNVSFSRKKKPAKRGGRTAGIVPNDLGRAFGNVADASNR